MIDSEEATASCNDITCAGMILSNKMKEYEFKKWIDWTINLVEGHFIWNIFTQNEMEHKKLWSYRSIFCKIWNAWSKSIKRKTFWENILLAPSNDFQNDLLQYPHRRCPSAERDKSLQVRIGRLGYPPPEQSWKMLSRLVGPV